MDILETNCLTQLSQSARHEALPTEYEDDFSDMADEDALEGQCERLPIQTVITDQTGTEDEMISDYLYLDDSHLIDIMNRLQDFQIGIFLPMRASPRQLCEYFEELSEEAVHAHDDPGSFPNAEIRRLFRRAAREAFRDIENKAQMQIQRFDFLKHFEQGEEATRYSSQCHGALDYPGASWRSWCRNTQCTPSVEVCRDALKKGNRVLRSDQLLPRGGIHIVHRLLKEGEAFVNRVLEVGESLLGRLIMIQLMNHGQTVIDDDARVGVIRTQLPDIESVYIYDKTESRHNHIQQKLTAVHGDVTVSSMHKDRKVIYTNDFAVCARKSNLHQRGCMVVSYHSVNAEKAIFGLERASSVLGKTFGFLDNSRNADDGASLSLG